LPVFGSADGSSSRYGPSPSGDRSDSPLAVEVAGAQPVAIAQNPATADGSAQSATTAATGPVSL
jgi:hypothetical protein